MKGKDVFVYTDTSACNGAPAALRATGAINYSWTPAEGLSDASISNPVATPSASTTYQLMSVDVEGCMHHDPMTIKLKNKTVVKAAIIDPEFICRRVDTITFINNSSGYIPGINGTSIMALPARSTRLNR